MKMTPCCTPVRERARAGKHRGLDARGAQYCQGMAETDARPRPRTWTRRQPWPLTGFLGERNCKSPAADFPASASCDKPRPPRAHTGNMLMYEHPCPLMRVCELYRRCANPTDAGVSAWDTISWVRYWYCIITGTGTHPPPFSYTGGTPNHFFL